MRTLMTALVMLVAIGFTVPAVAQTHPAPNTASSSGPISINMVGGSLLALTTATGLVGLYNAGSMMLQGAPISEALEVGAGLPLIAVAGIVILGGIYGQDVYKQVKTAISGSVEHGR